MSHPRHRGTQFMVICAMSLALLVAGCGDSDSGTADTNNAASGAPEKKPLNLGYLVTGNLGNKDFYDSANNALETAKAELGAKVTVVQGGPDNPTGWEQQLDQLSQQGLDAIVLTPVDDPDGLTAVMKKYPDQKYISFDITVDLPNVTSLVYASHEGGYISGVLAGLMTTDRKQYSLAAGSKQVGFITGLKLPVTEDFRLGFTQGAQSVDPSIEVKSAVIGSFADQTKAFNLASAMYADGVDVIYSEAGSAQVGIAKAAKAENKYMIGGTVDVNNLQPGHTIASDIKDVESSVLVAVKDLDNGKFEAGKTRYFGAGEVGGMSLVYDEEHVSQETRDKVDAAAKDVADGKVTVESETKVPSS